MKSTRKLNNAYILAIIGAQLLALSIIEYFFLIDTDLVRWLIDGSLYFLAFWLLVSGRVSIDRLVIAYFLLFLVYVFFFFLTSLDALDLLKRFRLQFLFIVTYIVFKCFLNNPRIINKIIRLLYIIGYFQLPIVVLQQLAYSSVAGKAGVPGDFVDFASGSVGYADSGVLGVFLVLLVIPKIQEAFDTKTGAIHFFKIFILAAPLGLINSDAQFVFLPVVLLYMFISNIKVSYNWIKIILGISVAVFVINFLILKSWDGSRDLEKLVTSKLATISNVEDQYQAQLESKRILRLPSMYKIFYLDDLKVLGDGPGYWLSKDSDAGESSITNIWYHCNAITLAYAETGVFGFILKLLLPILVFFQASRLSSGSVVKSQQLYLAMVLFYLHPYSRLTIVLAMLIFVLHDQYNKKQDRIKRHLSVQP